MRRSVHPIVGAAVLAAPMFLVPSFLSAQEPARPGERIPASAISPLVLESMDVVLEREKRAVHSPNTHGLWNGQDGRWLVPSESMRLATHSGTRALINEWGDPRIGIGFNQLVDLDGLWLAGHAATAAPAVRIVGYRSGTEVQRTSWLGLGHDSQRIALGFAGVDRIEFQVTGVVGRAGWIALDDLSFAPQGQPQAAVVLDFEDCAFRTPLSGSEYRGLDWETGSGFRNPIDDRDVIHAPVAVETNSGELAAEGPDSSAQPNGLLPTPPTVWENFVGATRGDPGAGFIPPDSCGAVGPDHYISIVNTNLSAFVKSTGARVLNVSLNSFWGSTGTTGDPRAVWDPHSNRFIVLATNFSGGSTIFLAISQTGDPTGAWFKFQFQTNQGTDAGKWPDYPTLGVDARGIYTSAYMVGTGNLMTIWAIDKAPLLAGTPAVGTITAFRSLTWEGAIQPCVTYGDPGAQWFVSRASATSLRLRRVNPPLTAPTQSSVALVTVPSHSNAPTAPALGSSPGLNAIDTRPMNAVFRNGSVWTIHNISSSGRAACRWYELRTATPGLVQYGTINDPVWSYYFGSVAVDAAGNVGFGFSGSHAGVYASTFVAARHASDPTGTQSAPIMTKAGVGAINHVDGGGRNRFGDYSHINVDPVDDLGFWTIQEFGSTSNNWSTWIARFGYETIAYGDGLAGTNGVPSLATVSRPKINSTVTLRMGNSSGVASGAVLVIGLSTTALPVLGGTLLVSPLITEGLPLPTPSGTIGIPYPNDPAMVSQPIYYQTAQIDAGAPQGVSFSRGLEVRPDSR
jgi:hypothetical protein